ncbi:MAG: hypothetical protein OES18_24235, partial [Deltaproteobacteria bacterium]|nr:hypothetical protein [Deltaproteobacteria bacterium]
NSLVKGNREAVPQPVQPRTWVTYVPGSDHQLSPPLAASGSESLRLGEEGIKGRGSVWLFLQGLFAVVSTPRSSKSNSRRAASSGGFHPFINRE